MIHALRATAEIMVVAWRNSRGRMTVAVVLIRPHDVASYARAHEAFVIGAAGIAALSLALATGVVLSVRR